MKIKLCIMSAFLSILLLFSSLPVKANSGALEVTFPSFPAPVEGQSSTHYVIIYNTENNRYKLYMPLEINNIYVERSGWGTVYTYIHYPSSVIKYEWTEGMDSWEYINAYNDTTEIVLTTEQILYSSFDLKYENGEIFFHKAPILAIFLMGKVEMGAVMKTVVYLIPLLIPLLVCLIGFRKAWAWLLKVLRIA